MCAWQSKNSIRETEQALKPTWPTWRNTAFPKLPPAPDTHPQVTIGRTLAEQNQAIAQYQPDAYGQISGQLAAVQTNADSARIPFYSGNLIAELVANSAFSAVRFWRTSQRH